MRVIATLDDLEAEAAAGDDIKKYLRLRGIRTVAALALIAATEEDLNRHLIDPLFAGYTQEGVTIEVQRNEQPIARAIFLHMWNLAKVEWAKHLSSNQPTPPTSTPTATGSITSTPSSAEQKAPKVLPPGVWSSLIQAYNSVQLGGEDREFPVHQVLGAESTLSRMYWEKNTSKLYSAVQLGELIQRRSFTAGGDINPLAKQARKATTLELGDDNTIVTADETSWSPRSLLAIMDGLDSIRWAMVLVRWGEEKPIHELFDWLHQRARSRPSRTEQFTQFWQAVSWNIAMLLRNGQTFKEITSTITKDLDKFNDYMSREVASPTKVRTFSTDSKGAGKTGKSKSQKGEKGHPPRVQPYQRDRWGSQSESQHWQGGRQWHRGYQQQYYNKWPSHASDSWYGDRYNK